MHDMIIGGTRLMNCPHCGKSMLDGAWQQHMASGECQRISAEKHHREGHININRRLKKLEDEAKDG